MGVPMFEKLENIFFFVRDGSTFGQHVAQLGSSLMPVSRKHFLILAYYLTKNVYAPRRFNKEISLPGGFCQLMSRHPQLCLENV